jgi:hypothetical protein
MRVCFHFRRVCLLSGYHTFPIVFLGSLGIQKFRVDPADGVRNA